MPGADTQQETIRYHAQAILAIAGRDGIISPDEQKDIRDLVVGLQMIGQQRVAQQAAMSDQPTMPSDETEDQFSEGGGAEELEAPEEGAEFGGTY